MMPAGFDVHKFQSEDFFGEQALLALGDIDDPALRIEAAECEAEGPGLDKIAECAGMENENVASKHMWV